MQLIRYFFQASRGNMLSAMFFGVLSGLSSTGLITLIHQLLDPNQDTDDWSVWFWVLCLVMFVTSSLSEYLLTRLAQKTIRDLRLAFSQQILATPLRKLEEIGSGRLLAMLTGDVMAISHAVGIVPILVINLAIVIGCLAYLAWLSWQVMLACVVFMVFGIVSYQLPLNWAGKYLMAARESSDRLFSHFRGLTTGTKELQLHQKRANAFVGQLGETADTYLDANLTGNTIFSITNRWGQMLFLVLIGVLLWIVPEIFPVEQGTLTGYTLIILYIMGPLVAILNLIPAVGHATVALNKVDSLGIELSEAEKKTAVPPSTNQTNYEIQLTAVTHTYYRERENATFTLGPMDVSLQSGEIVFVIGGNGSGKTTLAKMLVGLYPPESGTVTLNGSPITDWATYRQSFSVIFSDFYLFESLLGIDGFNLDDRARSYLEQLQIEHKVTIENGQFSTTALSAGQRKRLALLIAYLEDRPFYVFDEWAAEQDPMFRDIFYRQILPELKRRGKGVFVITHDDRYFDLADRVIKLEYGQLVTPDPSMEVSA